MNALRTPIACPNCGSWRKYYGADFCRCGHCGEHLAQFGVGENPDEEES